MLKQAGIGLLEMMIIIMLSALFLAHAVHFIPSFHYRYFTLYHQEHIKRTLRHALQPLVQNVRRAGFLHNISDGSIDTGLMISQDKRSICLCYNSFLYSEQGMLQKKRRLNSIKIVYRFHDHNIEFWMKGEGAEGKQWRRLFDPKTIKIHDFKINDRGHYAEIFIKGSSIKIKSSTHTVLLRVKYENH